MKTQTKPVDPKTIKAFDWKEGAEVATESHRTGQITRLGSVLRVTSTQVVTMFGNLEQRYYLNGRSVGAPGHSLGYSLVIPNEDQKRDLEKRNADLRASNERFAIHKAELEAITKDIPGSVIEANDTTYELTAFVPKEKIEAVVAAISAVLK